MPDMKTNEIHKLTKIVPWQESWEQTFSAEKQMIESTLASAGLKAAVYHVGSTSVRGMASKPIIDILLCPGKDHDLLDYLSPLEGIRYDCLGECGREGRFFLTKGTEENKTFYLHLCYVDHPVAVDQLLFQKIERNDTTVFNSYLALKQELAAVYPENRNQYRTVKGMFVDGMLAAYRRGEKDTRFKNASADDHRIKYWIYEFEMSDEARQQLETVCAMQEMTPDEFFEAAVENDIREAEADPEGFKQRCLEAQKAGDSIRLVRYYPVYKGETEAQAYKRKLAEEAAKKDGGHEGHTDNE